MVENVNIKFEKSNGHEKRTSNLKQSNDDDKNR